MLYMVLFTVDLLMSLEAPAPPPTTHTNDNGTNVVVGTGPAVPEQTDPSEVVVKKPTPLPTGMQLSYVYYEWYLHHYNIM